MQNFSIKLNFLHVMQLKHSKSFVTSSVLQRTLAVELFTENNCYKRGICFIHFPSKPQLFFINFVLTGEFPIISPGHVYEYTSCTTFSTTSGYMEGYYTFHCLYYKDKFFNVTIPRFHMVCPTFKVSTARMVSRVVVYAVLDFPSNLLFLQKIRFNVRFHG